MVTFARWIVRAVMFSTFHVKPLREDGTNRAHSPCVRVRGGGGHLGDGDDSSVVFQGGVLQEPRVLALDELIPVEEVGQACKGSHPCSLSKRSWCLEAVGQSLEEWHAGGKVAGGSGGYFIIVGGKILDPAVGVGALGLGDRSEVVFHRGLPRRRVG